MFFIRPLWHCLWFLQIILHVVLAALLIRQRFYRQFPIFLGYVSWAALGGVILLGMNYAPFFTDNEYATAFAVAAAGDTLMCFGIIYEIFQCLLTGYPALHKSATALFRWAIVLLCAIVVALAWLAPASGASHLMSGFFLLQRTVDILLCGLLLFLFAFSRLFGLTWRSYVIGIALGLGILASVELATSAIRAQIEPIARNYTVEIMELINQGTYCCSVLAWICYLFLREPQPTTIVKTLPDHDLETWNEELQRLLHQ
jgi:hypothetical protein